MVLSFVCCISVLAAEKTPEVMAPLKVIELSLPPGERSVVELIVTPEGTIRGRTEGRKPHSFEYDPGSGEVRTAPRALPAVGNAAAWLREPTAEVSFVLTGDGTLTKAELPGRAKWLDLGKVAGVRPKEKEGFQLSKALVRDADGIVYTAGKDGLLYRYVPGSNQVEQLAVRLPAVVGREPWASLDAAVLGPDGLIYGGTFDGYIFTFHPKTLEVINQGKPLRQQRIQGFAFSKGRLYGVGGEPDGLPRAFAFDPQSKSFQLGGLLRFGAGTYDFIMEPVGAMVADPDGTIYLGSTGRLGNVFVWQPR
jgi:hypothetical protein